MDWTVREAEHKLDEIADKALHEGPQRILRDDDVVVMISEDEYRQLKRDRAVEKNDFLEFLRNGPGLDDLDLTRDKSPMREFDW